MSPQKTESLRSIHNLFDIPRMGMLRSEEDQEIGRIFLCLMLSRL